MPKAGDQVPDGPTSFARRLAAVEKQLRELRAARRLENASVGKGGVRVIDGGRLAMDTPSQVRMIDIGKINQTDYNHGDGTPQQAVLFRREDGTLFMSCFSYPPFGSETQAWKFYDRGGNVVIAEDTNTGQGLARPYLDVPMGPSFDGGWDYWPRNGTTTMAGLWEGRFYKQLPKITVLVRTSMDTAGATGFIELAVNGVAQGSPTSVSFSAGYVTLGPFSLDGYGHMEQISLIVQGRRNTGTGAIRASVVSAYNL
ncbi:hypothetical protein OOK29_26130 [Streptomyces phaeochromogenes]|uniref:hypothetical protein n=1 Tax=Streptomyces phaeochromogenes TaxID=1923 RepID=UPI0022595D3F|nr:hypothetical protein [Streptomyces phaeochromogenes]MCX5601634.1 hypothetical protein [Streptomyces phaeochromogenes]